MSSLFPMSRCTPSPVSASKRARGRLWKDGTSFFKLLSPIISEMMHEIERDTSVLVEEGEPTPTHKGRKDV